MTVAGFHRLKIQQIGSVCLFELSWGEGLQLQAELPAPRYVMECYRQWQSAYLNFYQTLQLPSPPTVSPPADALRGRAQAGGSVAPVTDWQARLVAAEAQLIFEFNRWLRGSELYEIRSQLAQSAQTQLDRGLDLFLTCTPLALARLPWEAWEIGAEFAGTGAIRAVRSPANIRRSTARAGVAQRSRPRILVILGDETGLDFEADRSAITALDKLAEVRFVGWQPQQPIAALKQTLVAAITEPLGWDVLLFAGHSNETAMTGGELAIAPGASISLREIAEKLALAQQQGLQFALFNSCSGLNIAESLIDLGLSQVAVMREPIHNQVAQVFLLRFLQDLGRHLDVQTALGNTSRYLRDQNLIYPSAYLVPSLFRHPSSQVFQIPKRGWRQQLRRWRPRRYEAIALLLCLGLSIWGPVQGGLLQQRVWAQAVYRNLTQQIPPADPDILLVQVDNDSLIKGGIGDPRPMDRHYLAQLIDKSATLAPDVVGIDYILDRPLPAQDQMLKASLAAVSAQMPVRFVLATYRDDNGVWLNTLPELAQAAPTWQGDIQLLFQGQRPNLLPLRPSPAQPLPFTYLLALAAETALKAGPKAPRQRAIADPLTLVPQLTSPRMVTQPLTSFSFSYQQSWLYPIVDFSLPPSQIYRELPAWEFLQRSPTSLRQEFLQSVLLIMPGGYGDAGVNAFSADNYPLNPALRYWQQQSDRSTLNTIVPGGELHAYQFHHFLHRHLVVPLPDLWLVGLAALIGKGTALWVSGAATASTAWIRRRRRRLALLAIAIALHGLIALQLYISALLLVPWLLPSALLLAYLVPPLWFNPSHD
ncbi:MAG: CHASE2 domain-containing protein [Leptolyngbyaceae cyanobacterium RM1_1_2]|nr:CHASE2 domain-containing protein [Leptolyngbyaceae cyanobacterium RM1_1_2]